MRVHADRSICIGAGQCAMSAPAVFDQNEDDGVVFLKTDAPPPELADDVRLAAVLCPAVAITLVED